LEAAGFFVRKGDGKRRDRVLKMMGLGRADYRRGDRRLVEQPGQGDLRGRQLTRARPRSSGNSSAWKRTRRKFCLTKRPILVIFPSMRTSDILEELPRLTKREREEIRLKLAELDGDGWADADTPLTDADKALIEARVEAHERDPATSIPWQQFERGLKRRLGE